LPQRPQRIDWSDRIGPKIIASQIDMLPTQRRKMLEKIRRNGSVGFVEPPSRSFQLVRNLPKSAIQSMLNRRQVLNGYDGTSSGSNVSGSGAYRFGPMTGESHRALLCRSDQYKHVGQAWIASRCWHFALGE
jgi:hypothetical protein